MRTRTNLTESITVRVTPEMKNELWNRANSDHRTLSNIVYALLDDAIRAEATNREVRLPDPSPIKPQIVLSRNRPDAAHGERMGKG